MLLGMELRLAVSADSYRASYYSYGYYYYRGFTALSQAIRRLLQ
jgi:hypothetical protein